MAIESKSHRVNEQIRTSPVRVISDTGEQLGIMVLDEAMSAARAAGQDLVEVAPTEKPPVCRIMDFGKFKYQLKKRQHKAHSRQLQIKEIRVRPKTGDHDIGVKVSRAREFLEHKDKVIVSVMFRGARAGPHRGRASGDRRGAGAVAGRGQGGSPAQPAGPPHRLHAGAEVGRAVSGLSSPILVVDHIAAVAEILHLRDDVGLDVETEILQDVPQRDMVHAMLLLRVARVQHVDNAAPDTA